MSGANGASFLPPASLRHCRPCPSRLPPRGRGSGSRAVREPGRGGDAVRSAKGAAEGCAGSRWVLDVLLLLRARTRRRPRVGSKSSIAHLCRIFCHTALVPVGGARVRASAPVELQSRGRCERSAADPIEPPAGSPLCSGSCLGSASQSRACPRPPATSCGMLSLGGPPATPGTRQSPPAQAEMGFD